MSIMAHPIDMESSNWREQCKQNIRKLKDEEETRLRREHQPPQSNPEFHGANKLVSACSNLYKHIRDEDALHFTSKLEELCRQPELGLSEVIDLVSCAGDTMLHMATKFGKQEIVELIADDFPQLITRGNVKGDTPLHVAARSENSSLVKVILEAYAKHSPKEALCRIANDYGNTPLHEAVIRNNFQGALMLYDEDKVVAHYLNKEDKSPLYLAVETGNRAFVDLLLLAPIENHEKIQKGKSPLLAAISRINPGERKNRIICGPMVEGWLKNPARLPSFSHRKGTIRSSKDYLNLLDNLLKARPELKHVKDQTGGTPLHCAALLGQLEGVRKLLEASPQSALEWNTKGYLPIHLASKKGHVSVVKEILKEVWLDPIDLLNRKGQNILHMAAKNGKHEVVKYILREKTLEQLLNEKDKKGNTPLHSASKYLHPKVLLYLTRDQRVDVNLVNNLDLTARDVVLQQIEVPLTFRELLSSEILFYAGTHLSEKGKRFGRAGQSKRPQVHWIKDQTSTLMLVTILVATVTFAAGFTVPGGFIESEDMKKRGIAALINRHTFQVFIICDVVAMYSSTFGAFILLWAQLGDFHIAISAAHFALFLVAVALVTMSIAFMAAVHLIVRNLSWLAHIVIIIGIIFLSMFLVVFALLMFPIGARIPLLSYISKVIFRMIIPFSGSYSKVKRRKLYRNSFKLTQTQTQDEQLQSDTS